MIWMSTSMVFTNSVILELDDQPLFHGHSLWDDFSISPYINYLHLAASGWQCKLYLVSGAYNTM